eukprot:1279277-Pyramimonas_sp.AAC.1
MMILFAWGACDQVHSLWPSLTISVVVDDGSLQATGAERGATTDAWEDMQGYPHTEDELLL